MATLVNKKNPRVIKRINDEHLIGLYLQTKEWELKKEIKKDNSGENK